MNLRSTMRIRGQQTQSLHDRVHGEGKQCPSDASNLTNGQDEERQNTDSGKPNNDIQHKLNNYVELCDSLVRKNARLEKQLDFLQRRNKALQKQAEGLPVMEQSSSNKDYRGLDPPDCSPGLVPQGFSRKTNPSLVRPAPQESRVLSPLDICTGKVLGEIDENAVSGSLEKSQMN